METIINRWDLLVYGIKHEEVQSNYANIDY